MWAGAGARRIRKDRVRVPSDRPRNGVSEGPRTRQHSGRTNGDTWSVPPSEPPSNDKLGSTGSGEAREPLDKLERRIVELEASRSTNLVQLTSAVIGVLGTGIGILAIVTLFGGIKMLARLRAADLPATEGVANMQRELLLAVGADELVPIALVAISAVLLTWLVASGTVRGRRLGGHLRSQGDAAGRPVQDREREEATPGATGAWSAVAVVGPPLIVAAYFLLNAGWDAWALATMCLTAALGGAGARLAHIKNHRTAGLVLLSTMILVVGALMSYWTNLKNPEIRPAVLVRTDRPMLEGAWIARSGDWFYIGQFAKEDGSGINRLLAVPVDAVTAFAVGQYEHPDKLKGPQDEQSSLTRLKEAVEELSEKKQETKP
jgi:hypothetical protein